MKTVKNEAELAGVLGHEISPITRKHILDVIQRSKQIAGTGKNLLDKGLHQGKKLESDRLGVIFAARVGYDTTAYETFLDRLRTLKGDDRAFFKTHPDFSNRLSVVRSTISVQKLKSTGMLLADRVNGSSHGKL